MTPVSKNASTPRWRRLGALALAALAWAAGGLLSAGCSNPYNIQWASAPDTVVLYSLALSAAHLPNAISFHQRTSYLVEDPNSTGLWDVAIGTEGGDLVLLPPRVLGVSSSAAVAEVPGTSFDSLKLAPKDTSLYVSDAPVPLQTGMVYAIRTTTTLGLYGAPCLYYAKMEPLEIDVPNGMLKFVFDDNPTCNDRRLIPPS